jgi:ABC-type sugar transport system permease subunit
MNSIKSIVTEMPLIVALSLILAVILNGKFRGRIVARAVFFLPVIIATGVVMELLSGDEIRIPLFTMTSEADSEYGSMIDFASILNGLDLPEELNDLIANWMGNIFGLLWSVGIQTVLFIAGLQSIPSSMYEVSKVEAANKWQEFWFITVPMLGQVILLVMVFTLIEQLTAVDNPIMSQVYAVLRTQNVYDRSAAMVWIYFIIVAICMGLILLVYKKLCLDRWSNERGVKRAK